MQRVFVYGTLKRGFARHYALSTQTFLGPATTRAGFRLYNLGSYPGLVRCEDGASIEGELYDVDDSCLEKLDVIEGVDQGLYRRDVVQLLDPWIDEPALTYIYLQSTDGYAEISVWPS